MKSPGEKFEIVDFLRGFSILAIIAFHYLMTIDLNSPFDKLIYGGGTGVHLFVLLSGFSLYLSYKKNPLAYLPFLKKRLTKIYLPYILIVTIAAIISLLIPIYQNSLYAYFGHLFFYKMFDESIIGSYGYQLWFISMIVQFYIFFIVIVNIKKKLSKNLVFVLLFLVVSIGWSIFIYLIGLSLERVWNSFFLQFIWEFALGMVIADNVDRINKIIIRFNKLKPNLLKLSFFIIGALVTSLYGFLAIKAGHFGKMFNDIPALIGFSSLAVFLYSLRIKFVNSFFIFTGKISFSLYLSHMLLFGILNYFFPSSWALIFISIIFCYIFSYFYNNVVNKLTLMIPRFSGWLRV